MDLNRYWREVTAQAEKLPAAPFYYLMSQDNPEKGTTAGQVFDVGNKKEAARRIVERTHRLATAEEIQAYQEQVQRQTDELADIELTRKQQFAMPKELQILIGAAAQSLAGGEKKSSKEK